jgi:uncharacterized membrane protein YoaK (UPF0700 family)
VPVLTDAWRTLVPRGDDPHGPLPPLLLVVTVVTGLVDGFSYLVLGHIFVANMTGNVVFLAFGLAGAKGFSVVASLTALAAFSAGAFGTGVLRARLTSGRARQLATAASTETILVAAAVVVAWTVADPGAGASRYGIIVLLGVAAGTQNAVARNLAVPDLTTTVLTLTITGISYDARPAGGTDSRLGRRGLSVLAMFAGGLVSATLVLHGNRPLDLLITAVLLAGVAVAAWRLSSSGAAWDR